MRREVTLVARRWVNSAKEALESFENDLVEWEDPTGDVRQRADFERGDVVYLKYRTDSKPLRHEIRW